MGSRQIRKGSKFKKALTLTYQKLGVDEAEAHVCAYAPPFGVVPTEVKDVYPLSQYEYVSPPDSETVEYVAERIAEYIKTMHYERAAILAEKDTWQEKVAELSKRVCAKSKKNLVMFRTKP